MLQKKNKTIKSSAPQKSVSLTLKGKETTPREQKCSKTLIT